MNFLGSYDAFAGSHALNHNLTKALLADPDSYEIVEVSDAKDTEFEKVYA